MTHELFLFAHLTWMRVILMLGLSTAFVYLVYLHLREGNGINLLDLLKEHDRISRLAVGYMGTLGIASWIMVDLQMDDHMQPAYFATYCTACIGPLIAKMFLSKGNGEVKP